MLNEPYLERLAAAGARPEEIDMVMCTHLHHDHVGWNTRQKDGKWVPTFPNARYVFSKPDVDYFSKIDADPKEGPAELGTFRECVVPILEYGKADLVNARGLTGSTISSRSIRRPAIRPATCSSSSKAKASAPPSSATSGIICCRSIIRTGISRRTRTSAQAVVSRRKVLDYCASSGALVFPGHVGAPFAGRVEKVQSGYRPDFKP